MNTPTPWNQPLFDHMSTAHGLTLLESEMNDIIRAVDKCRWHDAAKELPDRHIIVLMHCPNSDEPVWMGYYSDEGWRTDQCDGLEAGTVTHWADLPEGPKP